MQILGWSAYGGRSDFENATEGSRGQRFLAHTGTDAVGLMAFLPSILTANASLGDLAALQQWLSSGEPQAHFNQSSGNAQVRGRGMR